MKLTIGQLAERLGAELVCAEAGNALEVSGIGPIEACEKGAVTFITDKKHEASLGKSGAAGVITRRRMEDCDKPQLIVKNVEAALIETLKIFAPKLKGIKAGVDRSAIIAEDVEIAESASIGPCAVIDEGVRIGAGCVISGGCKIGENTRIGDNSRLDSNVVIYHNCQIGKNVIIQANSTIGSTGFGYSFIDGAHRLIPHNGGVVIEDFVEIGANSCVDRAKFGQTRIGAGTKIDNHVQIAHNVQIGKCCILAGQVAIAGSSKLGNGVVMGGRSGTADHVELGDGVIVGGVSAAFSSFGKGRKLWGMPAIDLQEELRRIALTRRLPKIVGQLKQLAKKVEKLEAAKDNKK